MNYTTSLQSWINYFEQFNIEYAIKDGTLRMYCLSSPHWEFFAELYDEDEEERVIIYQDTPFNEEVIEYTKSL